MAKSLDIAYPNVLYPVSSLASHWKNMKKRFRWVTHFAFEEDGYRWAPDRVCRAPLMPLKKALSEMACSWTRNVLPRSKASCDSEISLVPVCDPCCLLCHGGPSFGCKDGASISSPVGLGTVSRHGKLESNIQRQILTRWQPKHSTIHNQVSLHIFSPLLPWTAESALVPLHQTGKLTCLDDTSTCQQWAFIALASGWWAFSEPMCPRTSRAYETLHAEHLRCPAAWIPTGRWKRQQYVEWIQADTDVGTMLPG